MGVLNSMPVKLRDDFVYKFSKKSEGVERKENNENEEEEKPIAGASPFTSEEIHGGKSEVEGEEKAKQSYGNGVRSSVEHGFVGVRPSPHLNRLFYELIEMVADEERSPTPVGYGAEKYDMKKLMFRQFERKPLDAYKYYKNRQQVIVILDDGESTKPYISLLKSVLDMALKRNDIIVYITLNGFFIKKIVSSRVVKEFNPNDMDEQEREKKEIKKSGLPVIYIGNFDGANIPIELSWRTRVFWFATEDRYKYLREHNRVKYSEKDFKGFFARIIKPKDLEDALKEFIRHINMRRYFYDKYDENYFKNREYKKV